MANLKLKIIKIFLEEGETLLKDPSLEQALTTAKVVDLLTKDHPLSRTSLRLKDFYYAGIRKALSKQSVKNLTFHEQF